MKTTSSSVSAETPAHNGKWWIKEHTDCVFIYFGNLENYLEMAIQFAGCLNTIVLAHNASLVSAGKELREAWEAGMRLARSYGDNFMHCQGEEKERHWLKFLSGNKKETDSQESGVANTRKAARSLAEERERERLQFFRDEAGLGKPDAPSDNVNAVLQNALERFFNLPNWENRIGPWGDVNNAILGIQTAYERLLSSPSNVAGALPVNSKTVPSPSIPQQEQEKDTARPKCRYCDDPPELHGVQKDHYYTSKPADAAMEQEKK